jgi:hypothetical protein
VRRLGLEFAALAALCLIAGCGGTTTASTVTIGPTTQTTPANAPSAARPPATKPSPTKSAPTRTGAATSSRSPKKSTEPIQAGQYLERVERLERTSKFPLEKKRLGELAARLRASGVTPPQSTSSSQTNTSAAAENAYLQDVDRLYRKSTSPLEKKRLAELERRLRAGK